MPSASALWRLDVQQRGRRRPRGAARAQLRHPAFQLSRRRAERGRVRQWQGRGGGRRRGGPLSDHTKRSERRGRGARRVFVRRGDGGAGRGEGGGGRGGGGDSAV